jgi:hypothetical protein
VQATALTAAPVGRAPRVTFTDTPNEAVQEHSENGQGDDDVIEVWQRFTGNLATSRWHLNYFNGLDVRLPGKR